MEQKQRKESSPHTFCHRDSAFGGGGSADWPGRSGVALSCADVDTRSGGGHASLRKETNEASLKRTHTHRKNAYMLSGSSCKM